MKSEKKEVKNKSKIYIIPTESSYCDIINICKELKNIDFVMMDFPMEQEFSVVYTNHILFQLLMHKKIKLPEKPSDDKSGSAGKDIESALNEFFSGAEFPVFYVDSIKLLSSCTNRENYTYNYIYGFDGFNKELTVQENLDRMHNTFLFQFAFDLIKTKYIRSEIFILNQILNLLEIAGKFKKDENLNAVLVCEIDNLFTIKQFLVDHEYDFEIIGVEKVLALQKDSIHEDICSFYNHFTVGNWDEETKKNIISIFDVIQKELLDDCMKMIDKAKIKLDDEDSILLESFVLGASLTIYKYMLIYLKKLDNDIVDFEKIASSYVKKVCVQYVKEVIIRIFREFDNLVNIIIKNNMVDVTYDVLMSNKIDIRNTNEIPEIFLSKLDDNGAWKIHTMYTADPEEKPTPTFLHIVLSGKADENDIVVGGASPIDLSGLSQIELNNKISKIRELCDRISKSLKITIYSLSQNASEPEKFYCIFETRFYCKDLNGFQLVKTMESIYSGIRFFNEEKP